MPSPPLRTAPALLQPEGAQRLVMKIGSALLVDKASGTVKAPWLHSIAADLTRLRALNPSRSIVVVSSGAVALGRLRLGLKRQVLRLEEKQAAAAVGQIALAGAWQQAFAPHGLNVAQVLLTQDDTEHRQRHLNARQTLLTLLAQGVVPVINENDTIATAEIRFGDNDRLAARVAQMIGADALFLLSDIDGLYTADPRMDSNAVHLPFIEQLTPAIEDMAGKAPPGYSSGGMITKLMAARIATQAGCAMVIANGTALHALDALQKGARHTVFAAHTTPHNARKQWLASLLQTQGILRVDEGAANALRAGKSLLPAGIRAVEGTFERGDVVEVYAPENACPIARGLCAYSSQDVNLIIGRNSRDLNALLGYAGKSEVLHRDDYVLVP
jgi:glutamate 5-kinase